MSEYAAYFSYTIIQISRYSIMLQMCRALSKCVLRLRLATNECVYFKMNDKTNEDNDPITEYAEYIMPHLWIGMSQNLSMEPWLVMCNLIL